MQFEQPLTQGRLIRRYKRFLADVLLDDGREVVAHCANPGSMMGLDQPGNRVWLSANTNPKAKLDWRWELLEVGGAMVGINTHHPNRIVAEAIEAGRIPELHGYENLQREVRYGGNSRIDILLQGRNRPDCYVEVKNVHLMRSPGLAEFPDARTQRGQKHLRELQNMVREGKRAVMFYLVQRDDCSKFALAEDIDPDYAAAFREAVEAGVEAICYDCAISPREIILRQRLDVKTQDGKNRCDRAADNGYSSDTGTGHGAA